jgi:hypothetical protein
MISDGYSFSSARHKMQILNSKALKTGNKEDYHG